MKSYFQDIEYHIINNLKLAESRLLIAVAWFTNKNIGNELIKMRHLDIEIIVDENPINRNSENIKQLIENKISVTFVSDLSKNYYIMHNKFCVIDNKIVITGSYNWTLNANTNDENITILNDKTNVGIYSLEFRRIKDLKFPSNSINFTEEETLVIVQELRAELVNTIKQNINKLDNDMLLKFTNNKIINKIRSADERIRNTYRNKAGSLSIYFDLIKKYGIEYNSKSTEYERVEARDKFRKHGIDNLEEDIYRTFQFFKIRSIKMILNDYMNMLHKYEDSAEEVEKIQKIVLYINKERISISKKLGITI